MTEYVRSRYGHRTLDVKIMGVLSTRAKRVMVKNRVSIGLTWSAIIPMLSFLFQVKEGNVKGSARQGWVVD